MALTKDVLYRRVGSEGVHQPIAAPLGAAVTVYRNSIALLSAGVGATQGYLKNASSPASGDIVIGMVGEIAGGTAAQTGPGIIGNGTDGGVIINCETGSFLLASGTGADALTETNAGATVYVIDEVTVGLTNGGSTRPVAGTMLPLTPDIPTGFVPVKLNGVAGQGA